MTYKIINLVLCGPCKDGLIRYAHVITSNFKLTTKLLFYCWESWYFYCNIFMCCDSRQAGHRIGEHLEKVIPLVVKFSRVEDDELREYCLQAFESFVRRCPKDISPHIPMVDLYQHSNVFIQCTLHHIPEMGDTKLMAVTLLILDRLKIFHCQIFQ